MAKRVKIEAEIEKHRNLGDWNHLRQDILLLSERVGDKDGAVILLTCECDFEQKLIKSEVIPGDIITRLESISFSRDSKFNVQLESKLFLGRIHYHQDEYQKTLDVLETMNLTPQPPSVPYLARLTAQACAAKSISMLKSPSISFVNLDATTRNNKLIDSFSKAANETIHFFKLYSEYMRMNPLLQYQDLPISPTIETVFKRLPKLYKDNEESIRCYRKYLMEMDARLAPHVKAQLARDCAMLILNVSNLSNYNPPKSTARTDVFIPETIEQEVFTLLLISDTLHEYIIDRAPEHDKAQNESLTEATGIIDLISICLSRITQFNLMSQRLEKTLKYAYKHFHLNFQFALSLIQCGRYSRAFLVLDECIEIEPANNLPYMTAAKVAIFYCGDFRKGFKYLKKNDCTQNHPRYHEYMAECYCINAMSSHNLKERTEMITVCLKEFKKIKKQTYYSHYRYGLELARANQINSAITQCKMSLEINPDFGNAFLLLQLLFTTQLKYVSALEGTRYGTLKWPGIIGFQILLCNLLLHFKDFDEVIKICKKWIVHYASEKSKEVVNDNEVEFNDVVSVFTHYTQKTHGTEIVSSSGNRESVFLTENSLTEIESFTHESVEEIYSPKANLLVNSWFYVSQIFIQLDKLEEAEKCVEEIRNISLGRQSKILFIRALIAEQANAPEAAVKLLLESMSINDQNCDALIRLAKLYFKLKQYTKAEKCLRDAIALNPCSSELWYELGLVLDALNEDSASCFMTSAELNQYSPLLDYNILSINS